MAVVIDCGIDRHGICHLWAEEMVSGMACSRLCRVRDYLCRPVRPVYPCRRHSLDARLSSDRCRLCYSLANESVDGYLQDSDSGVCPAVGFGCVEVC
jgi:hypothetical protein